MHISICHLTKVGQKGHYLTKVGQLIILTIVGQKDHPLFSIKFGACIF